MGLTKLEKVEEVYNILKSYTGTNSFIISRRNQVLAYRTKSLNAFEMEYILNNACKEPKLINKIVRVADWWGNKKAEEWNTGFPILKLKITWFLGETQDFYHFYAIYRRSQEKAVEIFCPKSAIITDFLADEWQNTEVDFRKYEERSGIKLFPHQEDAVKFLVHRQKAILADTMGFGKTISATVSALEGGYEHILIVCPASLKETWRKELLNYINEDELTVVEGSTWKENKFTIINYDILKNFYEVPTEEIEEKRLSLDENDKVVTVTKTKTVVSRKKSVIEKAMDNSQLFKSKFDLMIIDEAHKLANTSSGFFKIMSDLVKRSNPKGIFELTGTPITNKPVNFFNLLKIINAPVAKDWTQYVERYCDGKSFYNKKERDAMTRVYLGQVKKQKWIDLTYQEKNELDGILQRRCKKIWVTNGASNLDELLEAVKSYYLRRDKEDLKLVRKEVLKREYDLSEEERKEYDALWEEYADEKNIDDKLKDLMEGVVFKQWLANTMTSRTIKLINEIISKGEKVVVFCSYDEELKTLKEAFEDVCVVHNGKMTSQRKKKSVDSFQNDPNIKVFIGNIISAGVGLTLTSANNAVFNSITFVPGLNEQAEDRIHRLNQTKDCTVYYQVFKDTYMERMFDIVKGKTEIINKLIKAEREK